VLGVQRPVRSEERSRTREQARGLAHAVTVSASDMPEDWAHAISELAQAIELLADVSESQDKDIESLKTASLF
jgi:hypothetical protein